MMSAGRRRGIAAGTGLAYFAGYLYAVGDLSLARHSAWGIQVADQWSGLWLQARSLFQFEGIAMLQAGQVVFIFSPLNGLVAGLLAGLVAVNVYGVIELWRAPPQCRAPGARSGGMLASLPALLAGGACCAPALLIVIGIPALGAFAGLVAWLIPLSATLMVASRWWQLQLGAPGWFTASTSDRVIQPR